MDDAFADKRRELGEQRTRLLSEMDALKERLAGIELELGAIAAYDEFKARASGGVDGRARTGVGRVTRESILRVVAGAGERGIGRGDILVALAVKGDKSGEAAVDNRLRDLKREGQAVHEGRVYRVEG